MHHYDAVDLDLLRGLAADPRASYVALAERLGLSRNTVQARMTRLEAEGALLAFDRRIDTHGLGYPLTAFITVVVRQRELPRIAEALLLAIEGVVRTETALSMGELIPYRLQPLVEKVKSQRAKTPKHPSR
jgi:DNA-binding Lrp family transcriptional regulator